jgi:DNA-binding GntR family transcriptional regulator
VSRTTLREALRLLEHEGLATRSLHRGVVVTPIGVEDVAEIYRIRRVIEGAAIDASPAADDARLQAVAAAAEDFAAAVEAADERRVVETDAAFHQRVVALCASPRLDRFFATLFAELRIALVMSDNTTDGLRRNRDEHRRIAERLVARHPDEARALMDAHLRTSNDQVCAVVASRGGEPAGSPNASAGDRPARLPKGAHR